MAIYINKEEALQELKEHHETAGEDNKYKKRLAIVLYDIIRKQDELTGEQTLLLKEIITHLNEQVNQTDFKIYCSKLSNIGLDWLNLYID